MNNFPYDGTSGWSGTDTSRERAVKADKSGKTARNHERALRILKLLGAKGVTGKELDWRAGFNHHGTSSGVLTVLHKQGRIVRLKERRDHCRVYVMPEFQHGRDSDKPVTRMTQNEMRSHLIFFEQMGDILGEESLQKYSRRLLDQYWPEWEENGNE